MIKEAIQYVVGLARPTVEEVDGQKFSTVQLNRIPANGSVASLEVNTLSGLVEYIESNFDSIGPVMVQVKSPTEVYVYDALDQTKDRRCYLKAAALLPQIIFERFIEREKFQIMLQANFVGSTMDLPNDKETVLKIISTIVETAEGEIRDNGLAQSVTMKKGVASVEYGEVPGRVHLKPFRTFAEITQPMSEFILRLREGAQVGLFEADGGAWELNAIVSIKSYLTEQLAEQVQAKQVVIIG